MPVISFFITAAQYWYIPAAAVILLALVGYAFAYFRALRPHAGTLEWIAAYDRPHFSLETGKTPLTGSDGLCLAAAIVSSIALRLGWQLLMRDPAAALTPRNILPLLVLCGVLPALYATFTYLLLRRLYGSAAVALLGSCLLGLNWMLLPTACVFAAGACLFACRFAARAETASFGSNAPNLMLTAGILTVGCYFTPALSLLGAALALWMLLACARHFVRREKPDGYLFKTLGLFSVSVGLVTVILFVPAALVAGKSFPGLLISADYYLLIARRVQALFADGLSFYPLAALNGLSLDWPLLLTGLFTVPAALWGLLHRRDGRGLFLLLILLACTAMWLFGNTYTMPFACALGVGYVWAGLLERGKRTLVGVGAGVLLVTELSLYILPFFFS